MRGGLFLCRFMVVIGVPYFSTEKRGDPRTPPGEEPREGVPEALRGEIFRDAAPSAESLRTCGGRASPGEAAVRGRSRSAARRDFPGLPGRPRKSSARAAAGLLRAKRLCEAAPEALHGETFSGLPRRPRKSSARAAADALLYLPASFVMRRNERFAVKALSSLTHAAFRSVDLSCLTVAAKALSFLTQAARRRIVLERRKIPAIPDCFLNGEAAIWFDPRRAAQVISRRTNAWRI